MDGDLTLTIELAKGESREDVVYFIKRGIRLQGTVTRNDEGVPDASVMLVDLLNDQGGSKGETMSDAEGRFVFSGKKPGGKYVARAVHPVHGFGESAPVMTNPAGAQGRLDVHLRPGQTVRGRLHTSDGSGVDNLFLAGTWTKNGLDIGSVESAAVSGMQAARAISGRPVSIPGEHDMRD